MSTVKISDDVPRNHEKTIDSVVWTSNLTHLMMRNFKEDPFLR